MDTGLLVLRVIVGLLLVGHGAQKLFGWFGGGGLASTAWFFRSVGYRPARLMAGFAGGAELVAGTAFTIGLGMPVVAAAVLAVMLNASVAVHNRNDRLALKGGYGYPLGMATVAAALGFTGAGAASLDAALGLGAGSVEAGVLAIVLGLAAGFGIALSRVAAGNRPASRLFPVKKIAVSAVFEVPGGGRRSEVGRFSPEQGHRVPSRSQGTTR